MRIGPRIAARIPSEPDIHPCPRPFGVSLDSNRDLLLRGPCWSGETLHPRSTSATSWGATSPLADPTALRIVHTDPVNTDSEGGPWRSTTRRATLKRSGRRALVLVDHGFEENVPASRIHSLGPRPADWRHFPATRSLGLH